jgi:ferredoxin-NADP reductase
VPVPTYSVRCTHKLCVAPHVFELHLEKPTGFSFRSGQFVLFDVPLIDDPADIQTRAYSIAASPQESDLLFVIKCYQEGRASRWIGKAVDAGTTIRIQGPFGRFFLNRDTTNPYLLVCTGTGIAPFRSHLKWALETEGDTRKMDLVFGVVRREDFFWIAWLQELEKRFPNLTVHVSTLENDPDWHGETGTVQERIERLVTDPNALSISLCGAPDMVKEVKGLCLNDLGVPKEHVHQEAYI